MASDFHIKRIYEAPSPADGARVLVDRVWPRGVSKDAAALTLWLKEVAPETSLRKWFNHDPARWTEFQQRYRAELDQNDRPLAELYSMRKAGPVTLLYAAHDQVHNHAIVLADYLRSHARRFHVKPST
jgi:uncharacterized protein YeaO (DUF488 family)